MDEGYTLPDLPYDYAALEPHYSARLLELHHDKHHAAYVAGTNTTLGQLNETALKVQGSSWRTLAWVNRIKITRRPDQATRAPC
jgi:Fe-Mn family superoxide dismutase